MSKERRRGIRTAQIGMRVLNFKVNGFGGAPSIDGFDEFQIDSVIDLGVGNYTIIFKNPFERPCELAGWAAYTAATDGIIGLQVTAVAVDRITILLVDSGDEGIAPAAFDADVHLSVIGADSRYNV